MPESRKNKSTYVVIMVITGILIVVVVSYLGYKAGTKPLAPPIPTVTSTR